MALTPFTKCNNNDDKCPLFERRLNNEEITTYTNWRHCVGKTSYREVGYKKPTIMDICGVMIIGESPGKCEICSGEPFVGKAGRRVRCKLKSNGIQPDKIFFTNACRCMLDGKYKNDKVLLKNILQHCSKALEEAIKDFKPRLIICFGEVAIQQMWEIGKLGKPIKIADIHGKKLYSDEFECNVFPTYHPMVRDAKCLNLWYEEMDLIAPLIKEILE
jgi:DNA polymerase